MNTILCHCGPFVDGPEITADLGEKEAAVFCDIKVLRLKSFSGI